jgi:YD repeat-containing protein
MVDTGPDGRVVRLRELRAGRLVWTVDYDPATGLPTGETAYEDDQVSEVSSLEFSRGQLVRRTVKGPDGVLLYTDTLFHWPDGTLRRLERDGPDGPLAEAAWSYGAGGALARTWAADGEERAGGQHRERSFAADRTEEDLVKGAEVVESRVTDWLEAGTSRETRTTPASGKTQVLAKDAQGRVTEEVTKAGDKVVQTRKWTYDGQGRVLEAVTDAGGPREIWTYEYRGDGTVLGRLSRGEVPVREETTKDGEKTEVRYFDKGQVFLVETWSAGKRTKETYYQKGVVVRERTP